MKRYMLFAGQEFYPSGGWSDFIDSFDSIDEARDCSRSGPFDWYHIIDSTNLETIEAH